MSALSQIDNASWAAELAAKNTAALEAGKVDLVTGRKPSLRARVQLRKAGLWA